MNKPCMFLEYIITASRKYFEAALVLQLTRPMNVLNQALMAVLYFRSKLALASTLKARFMELWCLLPYPFTLRMIRA